MAYPDRWEKGLDPFRDEVPEQYEKIPKDDTGHPLNTDAGIIHFDLDAQNVSCNGSEDWKAKTDKE